MTDSVFVSHSFPSRKHASAWYLFLGLLAGVTLLPLVLVPVVARAVPEGSPAMYAYGIVIFLSTNFHVASTGWFFTDREMRSHFWSRPGRYLIVPAGIILSTAAAFHFLGPDVRTCIVLIFVTWLLWHYQKQNIGLLSFVAAGTDGVALSVWERRTLMLTGLAGMTGVFSVAQVVPAHLSSEFARLHQIGLLIYLLVPVGFAIAVMKSPQLRTNRVRLLFFLAGAAFYVPVFVFSDPVSAVTGCATAHGLQYLVFMGSVSGSGQSTFRPVAIMLVIATGGAFLLDGVDNLAGTELGSALRGLFFGVVMSHFVLDAGIWRLREPFQRGYMRRKFFFVFER